MPRMALQKRTNLYSSPDTPNRVDLAYPLRSPPITVDGQIITTDEKCVENAQGDLECKPAAGTMALLKDGRILYLNALEGTENVETSIVGEFGQVSINDQSRVLALNGNDAPTWLKPDPLRAGANPDGNDSETLLNQHAPGRRHRQCR